MIKKFSFILYKIIYFLDLVFFKLTRRSILIWFKEFIQNDSYKSIKLFDKSIKFFIPNQLTEYRVNTFFTKEPETLEWIDKFNNKDKIVFWDIGANIGLYSIYAVLKHKNIIVQSFEPSTSNLRVLSRNLSINGLENKIYINQFPLMINDNTHDLMMESTFMEGGALHSFGKDLDFQGNKINVQNKYKIYGFSINFLIKKLNFEIPNYVKIDVDGLEHHVLQGADDILNESKIKGFLIEINENYKEQQEKVKNIMKKYNFKLIKKDQSKFINLSDEYKASFNYIFTR